MSFYDDAFGYDRDLAYDAGTAYGSSGSGSGSSVYFDAHGLSPDLTSYDRAGADLHYDLSTNMPGAFVDDLGYGTSAVGAASLEPQIYDNYSPRYRDQDALVSQDPAFSPHDSYDLYESMYWLNDDLLPLAELWGDSWTSSNYGLADLMYYQRQLELDQAIDEAERLRRWQDRLRWEALDDAQRHLQYQAMDPYRRSCLGLSSGYWGAHYGGQHGVDLGYLRGLSLARGVFSSPYRSMWSRFPSLSRRYGPHLNRPPIRHHRQFARPRRTTLADFRSRSLSNDAALSLRDEELRLRLRIAETRASLTSLSPAERARALEDARYLKQQLSHEHRLAREIDRQEAQLDAVATAQELANRRQELEAERNMSRELQDVAFMSQYNDIGHHRRRRSMFNS
ncbi:hypothetical protein OIO90_000570 [Microbotryomycetes sp. JL221]|nr:hypothetical protein OIO90_000570 [Microbotryomycetes sp. JL221]